MGNYQFANNWEFEIRVDFSRPGTSIDYRLDGDDDWLPTPFSSSEMNHLNADNILGEIGEWLDGL